MHTSSTRYTKIKLVISSCLVWLSLGVFILTSESTFAQSSNSEGNSDPQFYTNVNAGFGLLYGGFGGNIESGVGHFAGFGALGYATKRTFDTVTISPSVNYHVGLRYYFNTGSDVLYPRVGIGYGWVSNYYNDKIGNQAYDQNVQGLSLHLGVQFLTTEGLVFNFDVAMSSRYVITNSANHPHFFPFYIRPCIGIGYELSTLFNKDETNKIQNKEIDPFGS